MEKSPDTSASHRALVPDAVRLRRGHHRVALSDAEVVTFSLMQEARSIDSEHAFVRRVRRDHQALFPGLRDRSRDHRRRKALAGVPQVLFARLADGVARRRLSGLADVYGQSPLWLLFSRVSS